MLVMKVTLEGKTKMGEEYGFKALHGRNMEDRYFSIFKMVNKLCVLRHTLIRDRENPLRKIT